MMHQEIAAVDHAARSVTTWSPEVEEAGARYKALMLASLPAAAILLATAAVLARLL